MSAADSLSVYKLTSAIITVAVFLTLLWLEARSSLRPATRSKRERVWINLAVSSLALGAGGFVVMPAALWTLSWSADYRHGLLHHLPVDVTTKFILGFLLMDLSYYYWHRANHTVSFLWRFHNVHHVDPNLDVSTSFRFHFGEVLYSSLFRALQVYLIGVSWLLYLTYEVVFQCATMFHHSNVRLPIGTERKLNVLIVTPRMHGIHHSTVEDETHSNYSVIFRWWDPLHGTLKLNVKQSDLSIGVPAYLGRADNRLSNLLLLPFRRQREYWRGPTADSYRRRQAHDRNILQP